MQTKRNLLIFVTVSFILLMLFSGCLTKKQSLTDRYGNKISDDTNAPITSPNNNQPTVEEITFQDKMQKCLEEETEIKKDNCLIDLAKSEKTDAPCEKITYIPKDTCFYNAGIASEKTESCGKIKDTQTKEKCLKEVGISTSDSKACDKIVSNRTYKDECYLSVAEDNPTPEICAKIFDKTNQEDCYINYVKLAKDLSYCLEVSKTKTSEGIRRDFCYENSNLILYGEDCFELIDEEYRADCFSKADNKPSKKIFCEIFNDTASIENCSTWYATYSGDIALCYDLNESNRINCINNAIDQNLTLAQCRIIESKDYTLRNNCYKSVAIREKDEKICEEINSNSNTKTECIMDVAIKTKNVDLCSEIILSKRAHIDLCIRNVALEAENYSFCEKIITDQAYSRCYSELALNFGVSKICTEAKRTELQRLPYEGKEYCLEEFAIGTEDESVCDEISQSALKEKCKEEVELAIICKDNDGICDENYCSFINDNDCKSPNYCTTDSDCSDYTIATKDTCNGATNSCVYTMITECISNDRYCPSRCTYVGDPLGEADETDSDCVAPCLINGGEICAEGFSCPSEFEIYSVEPNCCAALEVPEGDEEGTNCVAIEE